MIKYSKFLSLVLRHKPEVAGLTLDFEGWVSTTDVVKAMRSRFGQFNHADLDALVRDNDKQRFVIREGMIRANQGHSVSIDLALSPAEPPEVLYHGTQTDNIDSILSKGLVSGKRQHVHLSADTETAIKVGSRRQGTLVIIQIFPKQMDQDFYLSENGVWLTDGIDPKWIDPIRFLYP